MKGKNKFVLVIFALVAFVATGIAFALSGVAESIKYANAESIEGYTAELDGGVIFSAERVYFAESEDKRNQAIEYNGYNFNKIETNKGSVYFGDIGLTDNDHDYSHKDIIYQGDFVMVNNKSELSASVNGDPIKVKQGIMLTLGGYYKTTSGINTNETTGDSNNNGKPDEGEDDYKENGAGMTYVSAQATRNGEIVELPGARGYTNGDFYEDFTWFIEARADDPLTTDINESTEGHYNIAFSYMKPSGNNNETEALKFEFDFYLLLQSFYEDEVKVTTPTSNGGTHSEYYASKPTFNISGSNNVYTFNSGTTNNSGTIDYPTLTFDYSRYDLTITHNSGDVTSIIDFDYDENRKIITLSKQVYNDVEVETYPITTTGNGVVTLMFADHGRYDFNFDYIYKYGGEKITIPKEQISFDKMTLHIYGYQLKYSKAGFNSADMTYLEIYSNNTMFILLNGFTDDAKEALGDELGIEYKLVVDTSQKTGKIKTSTTGQITPNNTLKDMVNEVIADSSSKTLNDFLSDLNKTSKYQKTDRGLWLTINDNPTIDENSFYYHSSSTINKEFVTAVKTVGGKTTYTNRKPYTKVTTFTEPGYYLLQVTYSYTNNLGSEESKTQHFAFQITSATPILNLYKTSLTEHNESEVNKDNTEELYAYEYTNQNFYAYWKDTEIFESEVMGKLYYAKGKYVDESVLKNVANGKYNSAITVEDYNKNTIKTEKGSYLLVLEVEKSTTKTYTYFTIDKDKISGLEVYEVAIASVDNKSAYRIKQDANLNYIKHTAEGVIDTSFTLDWSDKPSGAQIKAGYKFTPFVKTGKADHEPITTTSTNNYYKYVVNEYTLGSTSQLIALDRPKSLSTLLDANNVLTDQGVYEFNLEDQAGNKLLYIVIVDRTEAVIDATYGEDRVKYSSGQMVADFVELSWGTHKAIDISKASTDTEAGTIVNQLLEFNQSIYDAKFENYYSESGNNFNVVLSLFKPRQSMGTDIDLLVVKNKGTNIKLIPFKNQDSYYVLESVRPLTAENPEKDNKYKVSPNGYSTFGWDTIANELFITTLQTKPANPNAENNDAIPNTGESKGTSADIKILVDKNEKRSYTIQIAGQNNVSNNVNTQFVVQITPDDALGEVYSASSQETDEYVTSVRSQMQKTTYLSDEKDENGYYNYDKINMSKYYNAQASNDGVFVFEWAEPKDEENFEVIEVVYNYYQLMDQTSLNLEDSYKKENGDYINYPYYPYKYARTEYILQIDENNSEIASNYSQATRTTKDADGNNISRTINRSNPINLGYENFYNEDGDLVTKKVTQTGLYIVTRTIKIEDGISQFSDAFFVDRNMIVGYDINNVVDKLVGQFIHVSMPNSTDKAIKYDNFNKPGLKDNELKYWGEDGQQTVSYKVYLETNKLPTQLKVPSGKYVSGNIDTNEIYRTSYINLNLSLSIYFVDSYGILAGNNVDDKGEVIGTSTLRLMNNYNVLSHGYIDLSFNNNYNGGEVGLYRKACMHTNGDGNLSLPGTYVFVISDNVGKVLDPYTLTPTDYNQYVFAIKLTNKAPATDVYAYAQMDDKPSDKIYSEDLLLYTNQEFVDFIIPVEDLESYNAQLDISNVTVMRNDLGAIPWLKLIKDASGSSFSVDAGGYKTSATGVIYYMYSNGETYDYLKTFNDGTKLVAYKIKLDTGLELNESKDEILSYKEYEYSIEINYITTNSPKEYYQYTSSKFDKNTNEVKYYTNSFYKTIYKVVIDRSPNTNNLDALMSSQEEYFKGYQDWVADQNNTEFDGDINKNFAYRNQTTVEDYYGLSNAMYYDYITRYYTGVSSNGKLSNHAMFAISATKDVTRFNLDGLKGVYYREIKFSDDSKNRMGLLPIFEWYFKTGEYYKFDETVTEYKRVDLNTNILSKLIAQGDPSMDVTGKFYEIVEKDLAGNYTQYIVYFAPSEQIPTIGIYGEDIDGEDGVSGYETTQFSGDVINTYTFIGVDYVDKVDYLANNINDKANPYYGNINIYNSKRENIKTIYINSMSQHARYGTETNQYTQEGIESEIYNVIKNEGNYIVEYVNVYGQKYSMVVNNYTSADHKLNVSALVRKDDNNGYYITFSELNTKINDTYWYVKDIVIKYKGNEIAFKASLPEDGRTKLSGNDSSEVKLAGASEPDRLNLKAGISYTIILTDVGKNVYAVPISTIKDYYAYKLNIPTNSYMRDNILYTATDVSLSYDADIYEPEIKVQVIEQNGDERIITIDATNISSYGTYCTISDEATSTVHKLLTLYADSITDDPSYVGSLRQFNIKLKLKNAKEDLSSGSLPTYEMSIDTRATKFIVENLNKQNMTDSIVSYLKNSGSDYSVDDFINPNYEGSEDFYNQLISETITISWLPEIENDYFNYHYQLFEFVSLTEYKELLNDMRETSYTISPKDKTTGKYIFKITITSKDGSWIASRVYGIFMSTTITGLYEVTVESTGKFRDYSAITNIDEIKDAIHFNTLSAEELNKIAHDLGFVKKVGGQDVGDESAMRGIFNSFGEKTAIPMYIANESLILNSNKDNGVDAKGYQVPSSNGNVITIYHIWRSNYRTFAVLMTTQKTTANQNILAEFNFATSNKDDSTPIDLLKSGISQTIYDKDATMHRLTFSSYNQYTSSNPLEKHNKIIIKVYYNNKEVNSLVGGNEDVTKVDFKNSGTYRLEVCDMAGNVQHFKVATSTQGYFTLVVMKEVLYTINSEAPIQYAYYDKQVVLQIDRQNNYDINTIQLSAVLNSKRYTGYEHPTDTSTYIFKDYGTYLITITAKLLNRNETVTSQLVFTILNPNEARQALDFTSICGYNIIGVESINGAVTKDVTDKFMDLLQDKSNTNEVNVYNKLITYERVADAFGVSTQGKMKFRVEYKVQDDVLLPARYADFTFTLNNETATITSSIEAGGKTTKPVTLKFNAANVYDLVGDCYIVINGEKLEPKIDESSPNRVTEIKVSDVGHYYVQLVGDSGNVITSFNFTIKEPLNTVSIILIVIVSAIVIGLVGTFIWLRTRMKVR